MDKQTEILNAALKLFVESGFHGTPTSKIAKEAGVANGTLFHYYKTKDELIVALYIHIKTRLAHCMEEGEAGEDIKDKCMRFYLTALEWSFENEQEFRFTQQFISSPYAQMVPEEFRKQSQFSVNLFRDGIKAGLIKDMPVDFLLSLISSHMAGVNQYLAATKLSGTKKKKLVNDSFDLIWGMIAA